ncbi:MAG: hypothetical protein H6622_16975 [Halobacteriovoraceae bacterium]|nr:hypothetical protein [Halobacteriovoraceae bacterium]
MTEQQLNETNTEVKNVHNFRTDQEVETLYRYIQENNLRKEAHSMIKYVMDQIQTAKKNAKKLKSQKRLTKKKLQ